MTRSLPFVVALMLVITGCGRQPPPPSFSADDEAAVRAVFTRTVEALRAGDRVASAGQFAEDAVLYLPNEPAVIGRDDIQARGEALPAIAFFAFTDVRVRGDGQVAWVTSAYQLQCVGEPMDTGKQLAVLRRGAGGGWEYVAVSFNSDLPPPGAPAAGS